MVGIGVFPKFLRFPLSVNGQIESVISPKESQKNLKETTDEEIVFDPTPKGFNRPSISFVGLLLASVSFCWL